MLRVHVRGISPDFGPVRVPEKQLAGLAVARCKATRISVHVSLIAGPCFHSVNGRAHCFTRARQRGAVYRGWMEPRFVWKLLSPLFFPLSLPFFLSFSFSFPSPPFVSRVHTRMEDPFLGFRHPARKRTVTFWPNPLIFQPRAVLFYSFFRPPLNFGAQFYARRYLWVIETEITLLLPSSSSSIPFAANNFPPEEEWTVVSVRISWIYRAYGWGIKKYRVNSCQCFSLAPPPSFFLDFYPFLFLVYSDIYF